MVQSKNPVESTALAFPSVASTVVTEKEMYYMKLDGMIHDLRNSFGNIRTATTVLRLRADARDALDMIERNVTNAERLLREAHDEDLTACVAPDFRRQLAELIEDITQSQSGMACVEVGPYPSDMADAQVPFNATIWRSILENVLTNATRKQANRVVLTFEKAMLQRADVLSLQVSVRDNGLGMCPEILEKVRSGQRVTDRVQQGTLPPGDREEHHGQGLLSVRRLVETVSLGELDIVSVQKEEGAHHGTTIILRLPLLQERLAPTSCAAVPTNPDAKKIVSSHMDRRTMIGVLVGGTAASAGGLLTLLRRETVPTSPQNPLRSLEVDAQGRWSFVLEIGGRHIDYVHGVAHPEVRSPTLIWHPHASVLGFELAMGPERRTQNAFLCHFPEGVFGYLHSLVGDERKTGYVCVPRPENGSIDVAEAPFHPLQDALYDGKISATSAALLQADSLNTMAEPLLRLSRMPPPMEQRERQWIHVVRNALSSLLPAQEQSKRGTVRLSTLEQWQESLRATQDTFVLIEPVLRQQLLGERRVPREIDHLRAQRNRLCLRDTRIAQAQQIIRI